MISTQAHAMSNNPKNKPYSQRSTQYLIKTVQYDRIKDKRIIDLFNSVPDASAMTRQALNFFIDHGRGTIAPASAAAVDAETIVQAVAQALLPQIREIIEATLEAALAGAMLAPAAPREVEIKSSDLAGQISLDDMVLD